MWATELLFIYIFRLADDAIKAGVLPIPRRPGPAPAHTGAELLTITLVLLVPLVPLVSRRSENGFPEEIRRDWAGLFPQLPDQPEVNRRTRWPWDRLSVKPLTPATGRDIPWIHGRACT